MVGWPGNPKELAFWKAFQEWRMAAFSWSAMDSSSSRGLDKKAQSKKSTLNLVDIPGIYRKLQRDPGKYYARTYPRDPSYDLHIFLYEAPSGLMGSFRGVGPSQGGVPQAHWGTSWEPGSSVPGHGVEILEGPVLLTSTSHLL